MPDPFAPPPATDARPRPPKCGERRDDAEREQSYRCDLYRGHEGPHHHIGTPIYWGEQADG